VGGLFGDIVGEYAAGYLTESHQFNFKEVNARLEELEQKALSFLQRAGVPPDRRQIEFYCEARYPYQIWELSVPLRGKRIHDEQDLDQLVRDFHAVHQRIFAVREDTYIECIHWRVRAAGVVDKPVLVETPSGPEDPSAARMGSRRIYLGPNGGELQASIYRGDRLSSGNRIRPPAIIEEPTTTLAVLPGSEVIVTKYGNYLIRFDR
jgi:N-methylhydantoinase A